MENTCSTYWERCHSSLWGNVPFHLSVGAEEKLLLQRGVSDYETYIQLPASEKTTVSSLKRNFIKALLLCCITISQAAWWCSLFLNYGLLQQCSTTECNLGTWPKVIIIFDQKDFSAHQLQIIGLSSLTRDKPMVHYKFILCYLSYL